MARGASSIQTEITALEAQLATAAQASVIGSDGTSITQQRYLDLANRLDLLYKKLGRANGTDPMLVRGVVQGLR